MWLLFDKCMQAAREGLNLVNTMYQLIGTVERVTEMMEMLDTVTSNKQQYSQDKIVADTCIAFEGVSIITPKEVVLVKDLSFRLDRGDSLLIVGGCMTA